jgi:Uma2 family endonuclease
MKAIAEQKIWTDEAFIALPENEGSYELINREVITVGNSGMEHGYIATILTFYLNGQIIPRKLGVFTIPAPDLRNNKLVEYFDNGCRLA